MKGKWITGVLERREYWSQREERERREHRGNQTRAHFLKGIDWANESDWFS